jgi:hypothetical protein
MLDTVLDAAAGLLTSAGITAIREYPAAPLEKPDAPVVCVGVKSCSVTPAGWGDYMGSRENGGAVTEVYGVRLELVIGLDIYAPAAAGCADCFENVSRAFDAAPSGLKIRALVCGETEPDELTELYRCRCEAHCLAVMERTSTDGGTEFTDFVLRGVLNK